MKQHIQVPASGVAPDIAAPSGLFDNNAASTARPVVPLAENSAANSGSAPRRSWLVVAIAISAVVGSLTGIAAFSLYQRGQADKISVPAALAAPVASAEETATATTTSTVVAQPEDTNTAKEESNTNALPVATARDAKGVESVPVTTASPTNSDARSERSARDVATSNPASGSVAERPRAGRESGREAARSSSGGKQPEATTRNETTRNEQPAPATTQPSAPAREPRPHARRNEAPAAVDEAGRNARPGYVDAVRRAIGDRPARGNRRARDANGERVREIFEGQPPRR